MRFYSFTAQGRLYISETPLNPSHYPSVVGLNYLTLKDAQQAWKKWARHHFKSKMVKKVRCFQYSSRKNQNC